MGELRHQILLRRDRTNILNLKYGKVVKICFVKMLRKIYKLLFCKADLNCKPWAGQEHKTVTTLPIWQQEAQCGLSSGTYGSAHLPHVLERLCSIDIQQRCSKSQLLGGFTEQGYAIAGIPFKICSDFYSQLYGLLWLFGLVTSVQRATAFSWGTLWRPSVRCYPIRPTTS